MSKVRKITHTRRDSYATSAEEIQGYKYFIVGDDTNQTYYATKSQMANQHKKGDTYFSFNLENNTSREAFWEQSVNNEWYLRTAPNNTEKDNLLELPPC